MKLTKRGFLLSLSLGVVAMVAIACGGDKDEGSSGSSGAAPGSGAAGVATQAAQGTQVGTAGSYTPAAKEQQVYTVQYVEPDFLDPQKSQFAQDIGVEMMLFRGLFYTDEKGNPIPAVAKEMPTQQNGGISADGKTWKITLKDNQKWSDGSALTARDFEYSLKRAFNPKLASPYASFLYSIAGSKEYYEALGTEAAPKNPSAAELTALRDAVGAKALDDKTLQVTLRSPKSNLPTLLGLWISFPVKQSVVEAGGAAPENTAWTAPGKLVGNGPFVLKERREKDSIVLEANPNYSLEQKPKLNRLVFRIIEDPEVAFNAWQTGELDYSAVPPSKAQIVDADPNLKRQNVRAPEPTTIGLHFQAQVKPLDNPKVRQAIAQAIDKEAFVKVTLAGVGEPTNMWLHPSVPGADKADGDPLKYDPAAAKRLLAEAGYPNGQNFPELELMDSNTSVGQLRAEFLQKQLKDNLNINIKLDLVDAKTRSSRYSNSQFQLYRGGWHEDYHDPENWLPELWGTGQGNNQSKYSNTRFDDLMRQAAAEQNNERRVGIYRDAHKLLLQDAAFAPIYNVTGNYMVKSKVRGMVTNGQDFGWTGSHSFHTIEIARE